MQCWKLNNKQRQLLTQFPFVSFLSISILSLSQSSLFSLSTIPSFSSDQFFALPPKIKTSIFMTFCSPMAHIFAFCSHHDIFLNNAFYKLVKSKFLYLSSNLSYPEDLKKQWLPFSILSLLPFLISPSLSTIPSCSSDQFSVLLR